MSRPINVLCRLISFLFPLSLKVRFCLCFVLLRFDMLYLAKVLKRLPFKSYKRWCLFLAQSLWKQYQNTPKPGVLARNLQAKWGALREYSHNVCEYGPIHFSSISCVHSCVFVPLCWWMKKPCDIVLIKGTEEDVLLFRIWHALWQIAL